MKKSIMPSILTGGAVIALVVVLIVSMVFVCLGDNMGASEKRPQQGLPQIISPEEDSEQQFPSFDFNDTDGYLEIKLENSTIFRTKDSLHVGSTVRLKELYGNTVTVKSVRYSVYDGTDCIHSGYVDQIDLFKVTVIGGGGVGEFLHTIRMYNVQYIGDVTVIYVVTWQDADGNEGVGSCSRVISGS